MANKAFVFFKMLPGFLLGIATVLDIGATMNSYHTRTTGVDADVKAIASDWETVGKDLKSGLMMFKDEYGKK